MEQQDTEFEELQFDMSEEEQHHVVDIFASSVFGPASMETYRVVKAEQGVKEALYMAVINHVVLLAITHAARQDSSVKQDKSTE